jgi:hypothetical protein
MKQRIGTFQDFKNYTLAVARGERRVDPSEPKAWSAPITSERGAEPQQLAPHRAGISHYIHSTLRERIVEHVFVGEALRRLWNHGATDVEVLRSEFDAGGYDLVMCYRKVVRHIQFKTVLENGKATRVSVALKLMEKPSGCVIWIVVSENLDLLSFRWFGNAPGEPLPDITDLTKFKVTKHARGNAEGIKLERPGHRIVPLSQFKPLPKIDDVLQRLFGPLP